MNDRVRRVAIDGLSPECIALATKWLRECLAAHQGCNQGVTVGTSLFPKRLVDVGDEHLPPRLIMPQAGSSGQYVALSHCWGGCQPLTTTTSTLAERQNAIPLPTMPLTFQHAVQVTRRLGFRYLWIDSLCIIQDSTSDWEEQAGQMQYVYEGAVVTIAADAGGDSSCGLSSPDKRRVFRGTRIPGENLIVAPGPESGETPAHFPRTFVNGGELDKSRNDGSLLQTRGWTFQERVLAPRVLHYGEYELAWECASAIACECRAPRSGIGRRAANETTYKADWSTQTGNGASLEFSRRWMALVAKYSSRALTYSSDKLPALAGLASRVARSSSCTYLAGHWKEDLARTLLWTAGSMPLIGGGRRHADYHAPSWSWASLHGAQIFGHIDPESEVILTIKDASCTPRHSTNPFGAVADGRLEVNCVMAPITVSEVQEVAAAGYSLTGWGRRPQNIKLMKTVTVDGAHGHPSLQVDAGSESTYPDVSEFDEFELGDTSTFLEVARARGISRGLIVRPSHRVPGAYKRIGVHETPVDVMTRDDGRARYLTSTVILV